MDREITIEMIIDELFKVLNELDAREYSNNCIHMEFFGCSWDDLCDEGIELFKQLKG